MSLKDALARVTRVARHMELLRLAKPPQQTVAPPPQPAKKRLRPYREYTPRDQLSQLRPHLRGFQKKRYQQFLQPLDMPQLRIYDDSLPKYNRTRAEANRAARMSPNRIDVFNNFLHDRYLFEKMLDLLVELTPPHLKLAEVANNPAALASVLEEEHTSYLALRFDVPRFHFHEVPPMPSPLTKESFHQYIFYLTHLRVLYKNSSSLTAGIVPEVLLYTHHLHNTEFQPFRLIETYNCLIKYFGYDKFQNSFARGLLLVMAKDGHRPNIDTINELLKVCRIHANRRFLVSTYKVVFNYLALAKRLGLQVNLTTWNRVYDCIDNIFLKEMFVNRISAISLPLLKNFCNCLVEDYAKTTTRTEDVIEFVEQDLHRPRWKSDPRMVDKVIYHKTKHLASNNDLAGIWDFMDGAAVDAISYKALVNAICANPNFTHKTYLLLGTYARMKRTLSPTPEIFAKLLGVLCKNEDCYDIAAVNFLVRGLVHDDAVSALALPVENTKDEMENTKDELTDTKDELASEKKRPTGFPYAVPRFPIGEHYKIMKRLTQHHLIELEGKMIYLANVEPNAQHKITWEPLSDDESHHWHRILAQVTADDAYWECCDEKAAKVGLCASSREVPPHIVASYTNLNKVNMGISLNVNLIQKISMGIDKHTEKEMRERNIRG